MTDMTRTESSGVALLGPHEIRALAEELDITPTKKLGQNFVHDPNTVRKIVAAADLPPRSEVVEVGPGLGSLTLGLLDEGHHVTAVEIDPRLAGRLARTVEERSTTDPSTATPDPAAGDRLRIIVADALTVTADSFASVDAPHPSALVANLPYNVSVPVLLHLLHEFPSIHRVLVMVQLEVADRLSATPGSKIYGVPSVKATWYGHTTRAATIGKNVFWPAPKIDSGLVRIDRWDPTTHPAPWQPLLDDAGIATTADLDALRRTVFRLVDAAFHQRRKTLRAALSGTLGSAHLAEEMLRAAEIDPQQRGEKLDTHDYVRLGLVAHRHPATPAAAKGSR